MDTRVTGIEITVTDVAALLDAGVFDAVWTELGRVIYQVCAARRAARRPAQEQAL